MTAEKKAARRKLSLLELASDLNNVSKACQVMGYSRQQFYEIRRNFQTYGADGLIDRLPGAKGPHSNRVSEQIEKAILDYSLEHPTEGCLRVAQELALRDIRVSSGGVRGVWSAFHFFSFLDWRLDFLFFTGFSNQTFNRVSKRPQKNKNSILNAFIKNI